MARATCETINGVTYPNLVRDQETLEEWILSIDRESEVRGAAVGTFSNFYREVSKYAYFCDDETKRGAVALVCQQMAMTLFSHLIKAPKAKIIWRIKPEFDVFYDNLIPSDLSLVINRSRIDELLPDLPRSPISLDEVKKLLGKEDWGSDFCTDTILPVAAPRGKWRIFKSYMRYAVVLGDEVINHPIELTR